MYVQLESGHDNNMAPVHLCPILFHKTAIISTLVLPSYLHSKHIYWIHCSMFGKWLPYSPSFDEVLTIPAGFGAT